MSIWDKISSLNPVASIGSSIIGAISGNRQIDKSIASQERENEKNRQFNKMQAEQQNQWNIEQWNRENAYNTPAEQMRRLKQAGLNPDLIYGNGTLQNVAASSPGMVASQHDSIPDYSALSQKKTLGSVMQDALMLRQMQATTDNIKADTEKKKSETTGQDIANSWQDILNQSHVNLNNVQIHLGESDIIVKDAQAKQLYKQLDVMDANIQSMLSNIEVNSSKVRNLDEQTFDLQFTRHLRSKQMEAEINNLEALTRESKATLIPKLKQMAQNLLLSEAQTTSVTLGNTKLNLENGILQIDYDIQQDSKGVTKVMNIAEKVVGIQQSWFDFLFSAQERVTNIGDKIFGKNVKQ